MLDKDDIQGMVFSAYMRGPRQPFAAYLFFSFSNQRPADARRWVGGILPRVTAGGNHDRTRACSLNVAFTRDGFAQLGLSQDALSTFSRPFVEGMSETNRARSLGDDPQSWAWGQPGHHIHVLLMLFATSQVELTRQTTQHRERAAGAGLSELLCINSEDLPDDKEHFGFVDGIAQPTIAGLGRPSGMDGPGNEVSAGELILGYQNEYGQTTWSPTLESQREDPHQILQRHEDGRPDFGRNGTYLVVRQMRQNVAGFWNMLRDQTRGGGPPQGALEEALAARIVGRWPDASGSPLALCPVAPGVARTGNNAFGFADDRDGLRCPLGAHIRRANPRDVVLEDPEASIATAKRHRLVRRGRPYGPPIADRYQDDGEERGLVFVTLNANIERQFEFVQHAWITSPSFGGLYDEADPLLGGRVQKRGTFTVPGHPARTRHHGIESFVAVRGGAYLFLPGIRALEYLTSLTTSPGAQA